MNKRFNALKKISVVIPCYNAERYLAETLRSVEAQTVPPYEVLLIDDGSRDRSRKIAELNPWRIPLKVFPNLKNKGIGFTRGRGILLSRGDYVAFLSSDDVWDPRFLERSLEALDPHHATFTNYYRCDENLRPFELFKAPEFRSQAELRDLIFAWAMRKNMFVNFSSVIIPIRFFNKALFEPSLRHGEDLIFLLDTILSGLRWRHIPEPLLYYRIHGSQGTQVIRQNYEKWDLIWRHIIPRLKECGFESHDIRVACEENYRILFPPAWKRVMMRIPGLRRVWRRLIN